MSDFDTTPMVGNRIVVTGMAGAGKSTFSRVLSSKTGLPVIHLDLHSWNPGWVRVPKSELIEKQRVLLAGDRWIVDSNDVGTPPNAIMALNSGVHYFGANHLYVESTRVCVRAFPASCVAQRDIRHRPIAAS